MEASKTGAVLIGLAQAAKHKDNSTKKTSIASEWYGKMSDGECARRAADLEETTGNEGPL